MTGKKTEAKSDPHSIMSNLFIQILKKIGGRK